MAINVGYLTCGRGPESDECYSPFYICLPLVKYIEDFKRRNSLKRVKILCPFDEEWSAFVQTFKEAGYDVDFTSLNSGKDFFTYTREEIKDVDIIISNPPFSKKQEVIEKLYELDKPFCMLLPVNAIQGKNRYQYFKDDIQMIIFDSRVGFHKKKDEKTIEGCSFGSAFFCRHFLPEYSDVHSFVVEKLKKFERPLV